MKFLKKIFKLPTPYALPMKGFCGPDDYTWDDWKRDMKTQYPIKYFLSKELPFWFSVHISMPIDDFIYKIKSNTYRKHHFLDLRQPYSGTDDDYKWGYIDYDRKLVLACFTVFMNYIEESRRNKFVYDIDTIDELEKLHGQNPQVDFLKECKALYDYWTIHRKIELKKIDETLNSWYKIRQEFGRDSENANRLFSNLQSLEKEFSEKETEMLLRLLKIRDGFWI